MSTEKEMDEECEAVLDDLINEIIICVLRK